MKGSCWGMPSQETKNGKMCLSARQSNFPLRGLYRNCTSGIHRFNSSHCTFLCPGLRCLPWFQSMRHVGLAPGIFISAGSKTSLCLSTWLVVFLMAEPLIHNSHDIYCIANFLHVSASLRTDSDLKAAVVRSGHASTARDTACSQGLGRTPKLKLKMPYSWHSIPSYSYKVQMESKES